MAGDTSSSSKGPERQEHFVQSSIVAGVSMTGAQLTSATVTYGFVVSNISDDVYFSCGALHNSDNTNETFVAEHRNNTQEDVAKKPWLVGLGAARST